MLEIPLSAFAAAHSDGAIVVDVREPGEYVTGHVPGATLVPMGQVVSRMSELPKDMPIYLICAKVDTEAEQSLAASAQITSIPTLMGFREGILVFSQPGALPAASLEEVIAGIRGLDMDDIRAKIAERSTEPAPAGS